MHLRLLQLRGMGDLTMLVLTRREGEKIVVTTPAGERIVITMNWCDGRQASIGTEAPQSFRIERGEVLHRYVERSEP